MRHMAWFELNCLVKVHIEMELYNGSLCNDRNAQGNTILMHKISLKIGGNNIFKLIKSEGF